MIPTLPATLPAISLALLGLILFASSAWDLRTHRIPNFLSLGGAVAGLACATFGGGWSALGSAAAGLGVGFACLIPFYALRSMGAGDVKLMAAVGSFLGPPLTISAVLYTFIAGGVLAVLAIVLHDGFRETVSRFLFAAKHFVLGGVWLGQRSSATSVRKMRFPYALAIALGTAAAVYHPLEFRLWGD